MAGGVKRIRRRSWSDLPHDIINLIGNSLYYIDQLRFRSVCRSWRAANIDRYADKLPWLMSYDSKACYLYDPSQKREYTLLNSTTSLRKFTNAKVLHAKQGWVLFSSKKNHTTHCTVLFFYSPFTGKIIELPEFHLQNFNATFSTSPISPDCMIFVLSGKNRDRIITCRPGDKYWTYIEIDGNYNAHDLVYVDGFLYCSFNRPYVFWAFNIASEEWNNMLQFPPLNRAIPRLIESDGNLLLSYCDGLFGGYRVFKFNRSLMGWFEIESLDDRALFISSHSCLSFPVEKGSKLANTIHYFGSQLDFCYKIQNPVKDESFKCGPEVHDYDASKLKVLDTYWILPPQTRH